MYVYIFRWCLGDRQRGDEVREKRADSRGSWGRGCKEEGRCTKRTAELLMRASRLALSTNARTHIHTKGAHSHLHRAWILLHITSSVPPPPLVFLLSHHPQPQSRFSLSVLLSLYLNLSLVLSHTILITSFTLPSTQSASKSCKNIYS